MICALYLPISDSTVCINEFLHLLEKIHTDYDPDNIIICGDFNLTHIYWGSSLLYNDWSSAVNIENATSLSNFTSFLNLDQIFPLLTNKPYTLDLFFASSSKFKCLHLDEEMVKSDAHHHGCFFEGTINSPPIASTDHVKRKNLYKGDYDKITISLSKIDWVALFDGKDINSCVDIFNSTLASIIENHIPDSLDKPHNYPCWFNCELIDLIINKKIAHCNWKASNLESDMILFKKLRAQCVRTSKQLYKNYIDEFETET